MPRSRKVLASAGAGTGDGASTGSAMTASGGLIAFAAAAIDPVILGSLTAATLSRFSTGVSRTTASCDGAGMTSAAGTLSTILTVGSDIADVWETWLNAT